MFVNSHSADWAEPRKAPTQERSRRTVERILDEAAHIFDELGYSATTTNHVAEAADVSIGSLYQYFPNKDALLAGLADCHLEEAVRPVYALAAELESTAPTPAELATAAVDLSIELNTRPVHRLIYDAPRTEAMNRRVEELVGGLTQLLVAHLVRFGHQPSSASRRARLIVIFVAEACHDSSVTDPGMRDELVESVRLLLASSSE